MPRLATGNVYERRGKWFARLTIGTKKRQSFMLETCKDERSAVARQAILAELAAKLRTRRHRAGHHQARRGA
ncbi:hypothetical protein [Polyangium jinanense]|uniref:Uncharacterized protein n=1 Tax=Polyangium jinanense TaxID=2829994 RepID=A0A9X3XC73_9BACT|nr:hypothetical protein [Polyangium jinanense]MDC3958914.1 hypothetical protein [Polyangium jinanense]MDC3986028.1 hypothetical protein [Polyangium jinanense]